MTDLPWSEPLRLNQIGAGVRRTLVADAGVRARIARALDLSLLETLEADIDLAPSPGGWRLDGRLRADLAQTCGVTLEPLPMAVDEPFMVAFVEGGAEAEPEVVIDPDEADGPDVVEDGKIDLGQVVVEQLSLRLDPFPRKPGATFVQPEEPAEISPFAALKRAPSDGQG